MNVADFHPGDRVMLIDETRQLTAYPQVGTVRSVSLYLHVVWDADGMIEMYKPESLRIVTGEDARPRHVWIESRDGGRSTDPVEYGCSVCGEMQTEQNYLGPCKP